MNMDLKVAINRREQAAKWRSMCLDVFRVAYRAASQGTPKDYILFGFDKLMSRQLKKRGVTDNDINTLRGMNECAYEVWKIMQKEHPDWSAQQVEASVAKSLKDTEDEQFRERGWADGFDKSAVRFIEHNPPDD